MKHVRALAAEPPLLHQYCTAYPNEPLRPTTEAKATWDTFKVDQAAYSELLEQLRLAQQGLCIYCEQRLVNTAGTLVPLDYQVEHVLPKSGAVGRVLEWTNLALACSGGTCHYHGDPSRKYTYTANTSCGQAKDHAELTCDPRDLPLLNPLVGVGLDGRLKVDPTHCATAGVDADTVQDAIKLLNLDCERLRKAREDVSADVRSWFVFMLEEITSPQLTPAQQQSAVDLLVARRLQPDSQGHLPRFWTAERSAIGSPAESWLAASQGQFA